MKAKENNSMPLQITQVCPEKPDGIGLFCLQISRPEVIFFCKQEIG